METKISAREIKRIFEQEFGISWEDLRKLVLRYKREEEKQQKLHKIKKLNGKEKVKRAMKVAKTFTPVEISRLSGVKYRVVVTYICEFVKQGLCKKVGLKGKKTYYRYIGED